jgi:hypothetical protein
MTAGGMVLTHTCFYPLCQADRPSMTWKCFREIAVTTHMFENLFEMTSHLSGM